MLGEEVLRGGGHRGVAEGEHGDVVAGIVEGYLGHRDGGGAGGRRFRGFRGDGGRVRGELGILFEVTLHACTHAHTHAQGVRCFSSPAIAVRAFTAVIQSRNSNKSLATLLVLETAIRKQNGGWPCYSPAIDLGIIMLCRSTNYAE